MLLQSSDYQFVTKAIFFTSEKVEKKDSFAV